VSADKIDILRAKYLESITTKESEIRVLREKLKLLDELDADAKKLSAANGSDNPPIPRYQNWKLVQTLKDAVRTMGANGGVTASEIRKFISANGYKHGGQNFENATVTALNRLVARGLVVTDKQGGRRVYRKKIEGPTLV